MRGSCKKKILDALRGVNEIIADDISSKINTSRANVYKILAKLVSQGRVTYYFRKSPYGRKRIRYYRLTEKERFCKYD